MMASMHAYMAGREWSPAEMMAAMRWFRGGDEEACVVARMTETWIEETLRFVDKLALIREALSFKIPIMSLSFLFLLIVFEVFGPLFAFGV